MCGCNLAINNPMRKSPFARGFPFGLQDIVVHSKKEAKDTWGKKPKEEGKKRILTDEYPNGCSPPLGAASAFFLLGLFPPGLSENLLSSRSKMIRDVTYVTPRVKPWESVWSSFCSFPRRECAPRESDTRIGKGSEGARGQMLPRTLYVPMRQNLASSGHFGVFYYSVHSRGWVWLGFLAARPLFDFGLFTIGGGSRYDADV